MTSVLTVVVSYSFIGKELNGKLLESHLIMFNVCEMKCCDGFVSLKLHLEMLHKSADVSVASSFADLTHMWLTHALSDTLIVILN